MAESPSRGCSTSQWPTPAVNTAMFSSLKRMSLRTLTEAASCETKQWHQDQRL